MSSESPIRLLLRVIALVLALGVSAPMRTVGENAVIQVFSDKACGGTPKTFTVIATICEGGVLPYGGYAFMRYDLDPVVFTLYAYADPSCNTNLLGNMTMPSGNSCVQTDGSVFPPSFVFTQDPILPSDAMTLTAPMPIEELHTDDVAPRVVSEVSSEATRNDHHPRPKLILTETPPPVTAELVTFQLFDQEDCSGQPTIVAQITTDYCESATAILPQPPTPVSALKFNVSDNQAIFISVWQYSWDCESDADHVINAGKIGTCQTNNLLTAPSQAYQIISAGN